MLPRRFLLVPLVPAVLIAVGAAGYCALEGLPPFDALYLTVITLTTVGYGDLAPVTTGGRVFTMFLALGGVFTLFYLAAEFLRTMVTGELQTALGKRLMERTLAELTTARPRRNAGRSATGLVAS